MRASVFRIAQIRLIPTKSVILLFIMAGIFVLPLTFAFAQNQPPPGGTSGPVQAVVVNEFANIRIIPEIGADVITTVQAGYLFANITGRSATGEWLRIDFNGEEGWVNVTPLTILQGNVNALPVADPRTIPFGGFESPRAGMTNATSDITGRLPESGLRVRSGPSTGYPVLADAPRYTVFPLLGRNASSTWVQVNFEGTLGWVTTGFIEIQNGRSLAELPINGIVADSLAISQPVAEDYVATLRLLLARVDLAQPSLDQIRASWTDSALTGRAFCHEYPARPSDYNIPNQLYAAFFAELDPIITIFNDAMFNVRKAIDLFIEVCNQPGTTNPVGQATVIGALQTVALADSQFTELRRRLNALIPPDIEVGADQCLFTFANQSDVLSVIGVGQLVRDSFTPRVRATGYCFDALAGQALIFETLQLANSNIVHQLSVSPFDNPTNFIAIGAGSEGNAKLTVGPVLIPANGRYLLVLSQSNMDVAPQGEFAVLISDALTVGALGSVLDIDPITGQPVIRQPTIIGATPTPFGTPFASNFDGNIAVSVPDTTVSVVCPNTSFTCEQLSSCEQAQACLGAGNFSLDPDNDGMPCEILRCPAYP
jgi:uncharacterized protein YraI